MARQSKKPDLYKDLWKRTSKDTIEERDLGYGRLLDYKGSAKVELFWDFNEAMKQDKLVLLKIDGKEVILDTEELTKYIRWV